MTMKSLIAREKQTGPRRLPRRSARACRYQRTIPTQRFFEGKKVKRARG